MLNDSSMNGSRIRELLEESERNRDVSLLNEAGELLFMRKLVKERDIPLRGCFESSGVESCLESKCFRSIPKLTLLRSLLHERSSQSTYHRRRSDQS